MKFSDILGNEQAVNRVRQLIDNDRLPHALLLHGDPGTPKLALARVMAQYMHCTNRSGGEPCGVCPSCRQHASLNHTDTFFSFPYLKRDDSSVCDDFIPEWKDFLAENPLVEDYQAWLSLLKNENSQPAILVRESDNIVRKMSMSAFTSKYKVLIMWLPEKMREDCANKLLKLIEEPFDDCKFILVSNNAKEILPTIISRTQRVELMRVPLTTIAQYMTGAYGIDMQEAMAMAATADGDVAQAVRLMHTDSENHEFHERFVELMRLAYMRDLVKLRDWSETIAAMKREKSRRFLAYCARQVRENFIYNLHTPGLNYMTREEEQFSTRFAPFINENNVERMFDEFTRADAEIQGNGNARIILFDMAVRTTILIKR
ncbi:MAG: DNA polymerase III subunit delta [Bacteroidales bacterium]|nr:DNA polymerase III subunit delta [Candidatus Sodaliphilus fimicaballi]